jgi:glyoxylase-like metal-dependent hydrolase (beta-lactamase superfamily II)
MTPLMRTGMTALAAASLMMVCPSAQRTSPDTLNIYVLDVEGGNATLFVSPSGESLLIDTGNGGAAAARDADRIVAAMKDAGIQRIDHLVITHYHGDHVGGLFELASRVPIQHFIDHGPNVQPGPNIDPVLRIGSRSPRRWTADFR